MVEIHDVFKRTSEAARHTARLRGFDLAAEAHTRVMYSGVAAIGFFAIAVVTGLLGLFLVWPSLTLAVYAAVSCVRDERRARGIRSALAEIAEQSDREATTAAVRFMSEEEE